MFQEIWRQPAGKEGRKMVKTVKKSLVAIICFVLLACNSFVSKAVGVDFEEYGGNYLNSINTVSVSAELSIDSGNAKVNCVAAGKRGTSKIEMSVTIEKKSSKGDNWSAVKSWSVTEKGISAKLVKTYKLSSKGTYRCVVKTTITRDGMSETSYQISKSKAYK